MFVGGIQFFAVPCGLFLCRTHNNFLLHSWQGKESLKDELASKTEFYVTYRNHGSDILSLGHIPLLRNKSPVPPTHKQNLYQVPKAPGTK